MKDIKDVEVGQPIHYEHLRTGDKAFGHVQFIGEHTIKISRPPQIQGDTVSKKNYVETSKKGSWYFLDELRII